MSSVPVAASASASASVCLRAFICMALTLVARFAHADAPLARAPFTHAARARTCTVDERRLVKRSVEAFCAAIEGSDDCDRIHARLQPWYWRVARDDREDRAHAAVCTVQARGGRVLVEKGPLHEFSGFTWHVTLAHDDTWGWRAIEVRSTDEDYE